MNLNSTKNAYKVTFKMCADAISRRIISLESSLKTYPESAVDIEILKKIEEIITWASTYEGKEYLKEISTLNVDQKLYAQLLLENVNLRAEIAQINKQHIKLSGDNNVEKN